MSVVETSIDIDAPPERVWKIVADPRNLPRWDRHVVGVDEVPPGGLEKGSHYITVIRFMGARAHVRSDVESLRPNEYSKVHLRGLVDAVVETWLEPLSDERTRLRHRVDYRLVGGPLGRLAAGALRSLGAASVLRHGAEAQKAMAERSA